VKVHFTERGWNDYRDVAATDQALLERLTRVIEDARRTPFAGLGKPEPLKGDLAGWWSRRITIEHRLVYRVAGVQGVDQRIEIAACKFHYA
jgi:toxin YoeB